MSPQLRLRLSHPSSGQCDAHSASNPSPGKKRPLHINQGGPSASVLESSSCCDNSQSMHHAVVPPSPSKTFAKSSSSLTSQLARRARVSSSSMFLIAMFAVGSMHRLHYLAMRSTSTNSDRNNWGAPSHLRPRRRSELGGHPRVIDMSQFPEAAHRSSQFWSLWGAFVSLFPFLRWRVTVNDPMLHHDGWKPSEDRDFTIDVNDGSSLDNGDAPEEPEEDQCVPMAPWQTTSYPNCNVIHEIDLVRSTGMGSMAFPKHSPEEHRRRISTHPEVLHRKITDILRRYPGRKRKKNAKQAARGIMNEEWVEFLGQGWFRSAWEVDVEGIPEYDEDEETFRFDESVVLKTLRIEREFLEEYYELHRRDAMAMERLTFSPYVLDIYGYCGQSALNELANFGIEGMSNLESVARSFRSMDGIEPVSKIKLQIASMVAAGVSHMHSIDYPDFIDRDEPGTDESRDYRHTSRKAKVVDGRVVPNATLVHYDLNPRNIAIVKRGKPKLNDFNVANFLTWDPKKGKQCGFKGRFREPWWRSPEEMHYHLDNYTDPEGLTEKVDVYSLGNILWDILTTHSPGGKMKKEFEDQVRPRVARGELPKWPKDFNTTNLEKDPALKAIEMAMKKCLRFKPEDRPTAGEIAEELSDAIDNLPEGFGDKEKWKAKMAEEEAMRRAEKKEKKKKKDSGSAG